MTYGGSGIAWWRVECTLFKGRRKRRGGKPWTMYREVVGITLKDEALQALQAPKERFNDGTTIWRFTVPHEASLPVEDGVFPTRSTRPMASSTWQSPQTHDIPQIPQVHLHSDLPASARIIRHRAVSVSVSCSRYASVASCRRHVGTTAHWGRFRRRGSQPRGIL